MGGCTGGCANEHLSVKALSGDGSGRLFVAIKTANQRPGQPFVSLLVRDGHAAWSSHSFGAVEDRHTRPMIMIEEEHREVFMFAVSPEVGGSIYEQSCAGARGAAHGRRHGAGARRNGLRPDHARRRRRGRRRGRPVKLFVDGVQVATDRDGAPWSRVWDTRLITNGVHKVKARAGNSTGRWGTSVSISFTTDNAPVLVDTFAPSVSVTAPYAGAEVSGGAVALEAKAFDNVGVTRVKWYVDGSEIAYDSDGAPWARSWDSRRVASTGPTASWSRRATSRGTGARQPRSASV